MEPTTRIQDRMQQRTQEVSQVAGRGMETMATWLDAQQRMWSDVMQSSTEVARQQLRFWWEIQSGTLEMLAAPVTGWVQVSEGGGELVRALDTPGDGKHAAGH